MSMLSVHGWIALTLGIVLSALLWAGLLYLSHYSAKNGYDDIHLRDD